MASRSSNVRRRLDLQGDNLVDDGLNVDSASSETALGNTSGGKKARGPTFMKKVWGSSNGDRSIVEFNKYGQPIGKKKSSFVHFIGSIARNGQFMPLTCKSWKKMPEVLKTDALKMIQDKFDFPMGHEPWILKSLGKKWKNWKSTVKSTYFDPKQSVQEQIPNIPPCGRVHADQWKELLNIWHSEEHQDIAKRNKASRAKQKMIHRTGKRSFAKVSEEEKKKLGYTPPRMDLFIKCYSKKDGTAGDEYSGQAMEKMCEIARSAPEGSRYNADNDNDIFAQVLGKEKPGHVRMRGLGVCPSDLWGTMPSRATAYRMAMEFKTTVEKIAGQYDELLRERRETFVNSDRNDGTPPNPSSEAEGSSQLNRSSEREGSSQLNRSSEPDSGSGGFRSSTVGRQTIQAGAIVTLKSLVNPGHVVAKGIISSIDPKTRVGGVDLGPNWCEVSIQVPVEWNEGLIRPYGFFATIGDAIGAPIAWPISLVTPVDFDSS